MKTLYLNCQDNGITDSKKNYLLRAAERMGFRVRDYEQKEVEVDAECVLNIEPCVIQKGSQWTGLWHIDVLLDNNYWSQYGMCDTVFMSSSPRPQQVSVKASSRRKG